MTEGKDNGYLGMKLELSEEVEIKVIMIYYLKGVIYEFTESITGTSVITTSAHLFDV